MERTASLAHRLAAVGSSAWAGLTPEEAALLEHDWELWARPQQLPPPGDWRVWLLLAGRGFGKTRSGAEWVRMRVELGLSRRVALVAPTAADARDVMIEGESGLIACAPKDFRPRFAPSKRRLTWPNGAVATCYSAEEPERLRGPQHDAAWCDELAAWRYEEAWDMLMLGLRLGADPRCIVTTTPKPVRLVRSLLASDTVAVTRGATRENAANLAPAFLDAIVKRYDGTRLGRQELEAELLEDVPGALWHRAMFEREGMRVAAAPALARIVVAIDPAATNGEGADETGIIAAGIAADGAAYVLEDLSGRMAPHEWAARAIGAYRALGAERIVAEVNNGGDMVDRADAYNPAIAEAQDDAAIGLVGLRPSGAKQLHLLCDRRAALASAQLQLGRSQVRNLYSFTLDRKYILLDPMDIVAISDPGLGLAAQWVRIREITENDDRSLSVVAEEYLAGTGAAPRYGHQTGTGYAPNFNADPGNALVPVFMDVPAQLVQTLGCEGWLATNGGPLWGGCEVWISSDAVSFHYAGTLQGGSVMGTLASSLPSGSDPDTANTLAVDLSVSRGVLLAGTQADADTGSTICFVDGEYIAYEQATLTGQYRYDLGKHGASAGYLRRGQYGSTIAAHAAGTNFVRLRKGTVFALPYDKSQIGTTIHVRLLSFNLWGGGRQTLDAVPSYAHTVGGVAPALSSVGALALASDLNPGAATASASSQGNPGGATASGTGMLVALVTTIGGAVLVSVNGSFGPGLGSPAATKVTLTLQRTDVNGTVTIYTGAAMTLPAANSLPFSVTIADAPAAGSVAYQLIGTSDQGTAPFSGTYVSIAELRR
jgi:phage terminase large subunit-like protein